MDIKEVKCKSRIATHDPAVEVAAYEVAADDRDVEGDDFSKMFTPVGEGGAGVKEGISNAVGEATDNEERYAEEERQHVVLAGKGNGGGHDEAACNGE